MIDYQEMFTLVAAIAAAVYAALKYFLEHREKEKVVAFFTDPEEAEKMPDVACTLPARSYQMSDAVKKFIVGSESEEDRALILRQIAAAEVAGRIRYEIGYSKGYYKISYGQIEESGRAK
jgi:hypothetical protein